MKKRHGSLSGSGALGPDDARRLVILLRRHEKLLRSILWLVCGTVIGSARPWEQGGREASPPHTATMDHIHISRP